MRRSLRQAARLTLVPFLVIGLLAAGVASAGAKDHPRSFLNALAAMPTLSASTVPGNGDGNPYGVAVVPHEFPHNGTAHSGDILVSNFNNGAGQQGMGTTIVDVTPMGQMSTFFSAPPSLGPVGLTTALMALPDGLVIVGNTPTTDGTFGTIMPGSLIFLNQQGNVVLNLVDPKLQGPWDMTADDSDWQAPVLYVSNVLNGTVVRINLWVNEDHGWPMPQVKQITVIGSGFLHRSDPAALVVGPTGLLLGDNGHSLFVADTGNNRIQVLHGVDHAHGDLGSGHTVVSGAPLKGPLALAWTPEGTIVASNGDAAGDPMTPPNMVVEFDPSGGKFVAMRQLDTSGTPGGIFGLTIARVGDREALIYVDDNTNTVNVLPTMRQHDD